MEFYTPLLEKLRVPQPSLQKFAVVSIFSKLRSAPKYADADSDPGRDAISRCLHSDSSAVVDQSVRELCRLVADDLMEISRGMLELQSALEGCETRFADLFVKGLGFLVRLGFQRNGLERRFGSAETHPFVKILSSRSEVQSELVQQVLLLMAHGKKLGMVEICEFLKPFLNYTFLRIPFSDLSSSIFARNLFSSMASLCCSLSFDAIPIFKLLTEGLKHMSCKNSEDSTNFIYFVEHMVYAQVVVLRHLARKGLLIAEAQLCSLELLETILSVCSCHRYSYWIEPITEGSKHLLLVHKDIGFQCVHRLSPVILSLFIILTQSELEHEQVSVLKLLQLLLKWKYESGFAIGEGSCTLSEELLLTFPVVCLLSSPSKSVKVVATDFLTVLEKILVENFVASDAKPMKDGIFLPISTPGSIVYRLLQHQWIQDQHSPSSLFISFASSERTDDKEIDNVQRSWAYQLRDFCFSIVDRRKSLLPLSSSQETFVSEMPLLLSSIAGVLLMHRSLGSISVDFLSSIAIMDPKMGSQFLVAFLFYNNIFNKKDVIGRNMLLKLLGILPALASHYGMIPLVVQTIMPMLQKDSKPTLYATAIRLLCKTWEMNDRAFGSLQGVLLPKQFTEFKAKKDICISIATSVKDVCRKNPDRGVDLILSVSACIESRDSTIQALGFQSLAHLCEADVVDFYTAWDVISKHVLDYSSNSILAHSICLLLRWGATDAEVYAEASNDVLQILWGISSSNVCGQEPQWEKARISALEALSQYEVYVIEQKIPDFKKVYSELLFSETNLLVLRAMEEFEVKIITYEHSTRRRLQKEKVVAGSKIEKLLDVFPQLIFSSGKGNNAGDLAGAALLCLSFTTKEVNAQRTLKGKSDVHAEYEKALLELATSLQLSRNVFVALLSLQSWKTFMRRWLRACISSFDAKASSTSLDKTSKAANDMMKRLVQLAKDSIPRTCENIALAIGALCAVLPPSVHTVKSAASKFLLDWLFQHKHEHRQWSAAISLGLISSGLHVTDHTLKFQTITGLLEVMCKSKSTLVKGACGVGLGFSCQDLLTRVDATDNSDLDEETNKMSERDLLGDIVSTLLLILCRFTRSSPDIMESLTTYFPPSSNDIDTEMDDELSSDSCHDSEEDIWGVAGVVLGLASSIGAVYRAGLNDAVLEIKRLIMSWIPHVSLLVGYSGSSSDRPEILLSVGSSLALPYVVAFCQRMELMDVNQEDQLMNGYKELILELVSVRKSGIFHQSLLMASCVGAGSLLSCILNDGVHSVEVQSVKDLLELFRKCYCNPSPPLVHLGAMLGVVNAMGADAGIFFQMHPRTMKLESSYKKKECIRIVGPLLSSPICEQHLTSLLQEIFLIAQSRDKQQQQQHAAWAVSFLRNRLFSKEILNLEDSVTTDTSSNSKYSSQNFADNSAVMKLSLWLMHLDVSGTGNSSHINTVVTVMGCLSQAPRLPSLDWGAIVRRCMRYEAQVSALISPDSTYENGSLRKECINFSLAHANQFDPLLNFLDELSDLARFRTLELNLQSDLLIRLSDLLKVFSGSRLEKLFDDVTIYLSSITSSSSYDDDQKSLIRKSCWKGLHRCLDETSIDSPDYVSCIEKCMAILFSLLPAPQSDFTDVVGQENYEEEWSDGVRCLTKARMSWLSNFLEVSLEVAQKGDHFTEVLKNIQAKAKLVRAGCFTSAELDKIKTFILSSNSHGIWHVLIEVVAALQHVEGSVKKQWLMDAVEISCVSPYPSTALQFLGLLSGSRSKYMPLLILDRHAVMSDLPVTLSSLLSEPIWRDIAEPIASRIWASTERIHNWAKHVTSDENTTKLQHERINESENEMAGFLFRVVYYTSLSLKHYLPLEKQLKLAGMIVHSC